MWLQVFLFVSALAAKSNCRPANDSLSTPPIECTFSDVYSVGNKASLNEALEGSEEEIVVNDIQSNPKNWGLARISSREWPFKKEFRYDRKAGEGVTVFFLGEQVEIHHREFDRDRTVHGPSFFDGPAYTSELATHTASIVVGKTFGVARKAKLVNVRVLNDNQGTASSIIQGLNWVISQHKSAQRMNSGVVKSIVLLTASAQVHESIQTMLEDMIDLGILAVVAAGDLNGNACDFTPGGCRSCLTIAASDSFDTREPSTNWGTCVNMFAPGVAVTGAGINGESTVTGTAVAAAHVAGIAASYWSLSPASLAINVRQALLEHAIRTPIVSANGSPEIMAYNYIPVPDLGNSSSCGSNGWLIGLVCVFAGLLALHIGIDILIFVYVRKRRYRLGFFPEDKRPLIIQ